MTKEKEHQKHVQISAENPRNHYFSIIFIEFRTDFDENLSEFHRMLLKMLTTSQIAESLIISNNISWNLREFCRIPDEQRFE